jgi:hypothetical protein
MATRLSAAQRRDVIGHMRNELASLENIPNDIVGQRRLN